jgi:DNA-binding Xre family transcriptional regulator
LIDFRVLEYRATTKMVVADAALREKIAKLPLRELMRKTGLSQHTIEAIRAGRAVRRQTLRRVLELDW